MSAESLPADRLIGSVLANRYLIESRLGEGAMGAVYKARHVKVGRPFAVKVLHARLLEDAKVALRFEREAELAGRLHHPNVVGVVDVGEVDGMRYMVMDFAEGPDLASLLSEAPMPPARIIHLVRQLLEGLYHAHEEGLIHRDFKPENIIIERDSHGNEVPKIVDFGIAILREGGDSTTAEGRLTTNGLVLGTPHYMAPEQAVADPIDHRIDLFALGIVIYELLCGRLPFDGSGAEIARANLLLDPPPIMQRVPYLEVDPLLEAFARKLMAKKRDLRPPTAKAARELLDLIERDPKAAAAALGLPLAASERVPATTLPVPPQTTSPRPSQLEAPPAASHVAPPKPAGGEHEISTAIASPLGWDGPRKRRAPWIIGGALGIAAIGAVAVFAVVARSGPTPSEAPAPDKLTSVVTPRPSDPTPAPPPADKLAPTPRPAPDPTPTAVVEPAPVPTPPPPPPPIDKPAERPHPKARPTAKPDTHKITITGPKPVDRVDAKPPVETSPAVETKPPVETRPPPPDPSPAGISSGAIGTLYQQVGNELAALPPDVRAPLWQTYTRYKINELMVANQADRDAAAAVLLGLRRDAAKARGR